MVPFVEFGPLRGAVLLIGIGLLLVFSEGRLAGAGDQFPRQRLAMIEEIRKTLSDTSSYLGKERFDSRVLTAMAEVERHEFVPLRARHLAYLNQPLPIGYGQTISQPYIVALMTDLLGVDADDRVLEVGTGSGYQAAILAKLAREVCSIEIIEPLGNEARRRLERLGYANVRTQLGDGYYGWPGGGEFDAIVVTAAASHVPPPLIGQLRPGGRMVIPVGSRFMVQQLVLVEKEMNGTVRTRQLLPVRFVPLVGGHD